VSQGARGNRAWLERARTLQRDRAARERDGVCFVEGIRHVVAALEAGHELEALLVDPARLRSEVAWAAVAEAQERGAAYVTLKPEELARISTRDNPVGIAALVRWGPKPLRELTARRDGLYLVTDDVRDPGNLGTLARTLDAAGGTALIVRGGTDPAHPSALRAALGTLFQLPVYVAPSLDAVFRWTSAHKISTVATSAHADVEVWDALPSPPLAVVVGNEGEGLADDTLARCDLRVAIPMLGSATSLNVSVAAGIILFEARRSATMR
jgi:RNA methyltransferase, TrmH family